MFSTSALNESIKLIGILFVNDKKRFKKMFLSKLFLEKPIFFSFFKHLIYLTLTCYFLHKHYT